MSFWSPHSGSGDSGGVPKDIQRWEETRRKGKGNYLLMNGVLAWGVPMFAVMTFVVNKPPKTFGLLAVSALLWTAGGFCFGLLTWHSFEAKYQKYMKSRKDLPPQI